MWPFSEEVPVHRSTKQNKQGNGPVGVSAGQYGAQTAKDMQKHNDANKDAMNAARRAMGLPPK